jgi:hypothetical protein
MKLMVDRRLAGGFLGFKIIVKYENSLVMP